MWHWALCPDDGSRVEQQGESNTAALPADDDCVLVVPTQAVSWHWLQLPKMAAHQQRTALESLLEDKLLEDPSQLQLALPPGSKAGQAGSYWVAVCHKHPLQAQLAHLQQAGRLVSRIVPATCPSQETHWWLQQEGEQSWCILQTPTGVLSLPLEQEHEPALLGLKIQLQTLAANPTHTCADARHLTAAEHTWPDATWQLAPSAHRWLQAWQEGWNLAQFDIQLHNQQRWWQRGSTIWRHLRQDPQWHASRWGLLALLAVHWVGLNGLAWQTQRALQTQQREMQNMLQSSFPAVTFVLDAPRQMAMELQRLRQQHGSLGPRDLETVLSTLGRSDPPLQWQSLDFTPERISLKGIQGTEEQQNRVLHLLTSLGWQVQLQDTEWQLNWRQP